MSSQLTIRTLNRTLLYRQWLTERSSASVTDAIDHLIGLQAQHGDAPYYQLWCRLQNFHPTDLSALLHEGDVARIVGMRGTIHLVNRRDCQGLRHFAQPLLQREYKADKPGHLTSVQVDKVAEAARSLLHDQPMNAAELANQLREQWPEIPGRDLVQIVRNSLPVLQVPPRGVWGKSGALVYALASEWLPGSNPATLDPADIVVRYLRAFGPASIRDFQQWSGLTRQKVVFEQLGGQLRRYQDPQGVQLFDLEDSQLIDEEATVPRVLLTGPFDNIVLSHSDRTRIIDEATRARLNRPNGLFPGLILIDGFVAGEWATTIKRTHATVTFTSYERLPDRDRDLLEEQGHQLLRFAAHDVENHVVNFA